MELKEQVAYLRGLIQGQEFPGRKRAGPLDPTLEYL